ncbi:MAG: amidase [Solirubrobacterales bacterium]
MTDELAGLDATAQAELVRSGEASPVDLVEAAIGRIEAFDDEINAVITPLFEQAHRAAAGELPDGPFRGVPTLLKDLQAHSAGDPFHEGMKHLRELAWREEEDTWLVGRLRAAGFVICGKTNTAELGILATTEPEAYGPTRNPWDAGRSPGGSSGGSAAAVAAGMVPVAHGNDGGGSIRIPASACGLVGLKPSRGRVTLGPEFGDVMTGLVSEHVLARSLRDSARILDCIQGVAPGDPYSAPGPERPYAEEVGADPGRLRIGFMREAPGGQFELHPDCAAAVAAAAELLEGLGHGVEESHPDALDDPDYAERFIQRWSTGVAWSLDHWTRKTGEEVTEDGVEASTWALAKIGRSLSGPQYLSALEYQQASARRAAAWWSAGFDLLLTPTMGEPPTPLGSFDPVPDNPAAPLFRCVPTAGFTAFWNSSGQPAISLPLHWSQDETGAASGGPSHLPIGVQLVAPFGREDVLIRVGAQLEKARPWADRFPGAFSVPSR